MPKKTLKIIRKQNNHYVVQVKGNQKNLSNNIKDIVEEKNVVEKHTSSEKKRGRNEKRIVRLYQTDGRISKDWTDAKTIVTVERFSTRKGKRIRELSYYMSSLETKNAALFAKGIRGHWSIENRLHWVKDVRLNEDNAGIKKGNGIETLSVFRSMAINITRFLGFDSIKDAQIYFISNVIKLYKIIRI